MGPVLDALDDGADAPLVIVALARAPFMTHGTLRVACRRLRTIIASRAFREWHHASDQRLMLLQPEHAKGAEPGARLARRSSACFSCARSVRLARQFWMSSVLFASLDSRWRPSVDQKRGAGRGAAGATGCRDGPVLPRAGAVRRLDLGRVPIEARCLRVIARWRKINVSSRKRAF